MENLGLDRKEAKVYLALLQLGESSVLEVSRKAKLGRTHTYEILDSLIAKGLVSFVTENKSKKFKAAEPAKILYQLKEKEASFMEILPSLNKMSQLKKNKEPSVEIFRGTKGMKAMVNEIFELKRDYCIISADLRNTNLQFFLAQFIKSLERENIHERVLTKKSFHSPKSKNSTMKFLPENYPFLATTIIYSDMVGIIVWSDPFLAIRINSKELAETYRSYFELLWRIAKKEN